MNKSFSSFNTPENIKRERHWEQLVDRISDTISDTKIVRATYPNPLPAHYQDMPAETIRDRVRAKRPEDRLKY